MDKNTVLALLRLMTGIKIVHDMSEQLESTRQIVKKICTDFIAKLESDGEVGDVDVYIDNTTLLETRLSDVNTAIREIVESVVSIMESCPMIKVAEVDEEDFNSSIDLRNIDSILKDIGIRRSDNDEHKWIY